MNNTITEKIKGFEITFKTKPGVFSKEGVDVGSRLLIDHVEIKDGTLIADLGCGAGIIGMSAAKQDYSGHVHLLDVNLRVIELAKENVELNRLSNVEVFLSDLFSAVGGRTYHLILSNPPLHLGNEFLDEAASECFKHLKADGEVYWVIQNYLKPVVIRYFEKYFGQAEVVAKGAHHVLIKATKS